MKFTHKRAPIEYEIRIKSWFAIFPITIGNETRWLERVTVKQELLKKYYTYQEGYSLRWNNFEFLDQAI